MRASQEHRRTEEHSEKPRKQWTCQNEANAAVSPKIRSHQLSHRSLGRQEQRRSSNKTAHVCKRESQNSEGAEGAVGEGESDEEECVTVSEVFSPWSVGNRSCSKAIHPFSHTVRVIRALIIHNPIAIAAKSKPKNTGLCNNPSHIRMSHCAPPRPVEAHLLQ